MGSYSDGQAKLDILPGLIVVLDGARVPLQAQGGGLFVTAHPGLVEWPLVAVRREKAVIALDHGSRRFVRSGVNAPLPATTPEIAALAGHYQSDDPWIGGVSIVARGDQLYLGGAGLLRRTGKVDFVPADPANSPERLRFEAQVNGVPQVVIWSGRRLERRDV